MIDIKTISLCIVLINIFLCAALFAAWRVQKVYEGFGFWVLANLAIALGNISMVLLQKFVPYLVNNVFFVLAAWLRLWGLYHFFGEKHGWRPHLVILCLFLTLQVYVYDDPAMRTAVLTSTLSVYLFGMTRVLLSHARNEVRVLYRTGASLFFIYGSLLVSRTCIALIAPSQVVIPVATPANVLFFVPLMLLDIGVIFALLMINDKRLTLELQEALARIKILSGILPICCSCKKIRDDNGYWQQVEAYVCEHTDAEFSHSICPECAARLYPELNLDALEGKVDGEKAEQPVIHNGK